MPGPVKLTITRIFSLVIVLAFAVSALGCSFEVAGTDDVALTYEVVDLSAPEVTGLLDRIRIRLASAHVVADVTLDGSHPHIVLEREEQKAAESLLRWRGGLTLYPVDAMKNGVIEPHAKPLDSKVVVRSADTSQHGHAVRIVLDPTASQASADAVLVVMNRTVLGTAKIDPHAPLEFSLGNDLEAYARADIVARMVATPPLPELREIDARALSPSWPKATLGLILPLLISLSWIGFVRRFDRAHPEPAWIVLGTFLLGGLSVFLAAFLEGGAASLSPYLNPSLLSFGGQTWALPIAIVSFSIVVGAVEEGVKLLAVMLFARRRAEFDEPVDGIVYGTAAALGFAAIENVKYFALGRLSPSVIVMRTLTSAPAHLFFGAIWGFALGARLVSRRRRLPLYFAIAALAHGTFDALLSSRSASGLVLPLQVILAGVFVMLLRRSLQHGAVREDTIPASALERLRLPLGSRAMFVASAIAMVVGAAGVAFIGIVFEATHARPDVTFFVAAIAALSFFGASAAAVTATLPLDLVVDDQGITFGGAARRWNEIEAIERMGRELVVLSSAGNLKLGPAKDPALDMAEAAIAERLAAKR